VTGGRAQRADVAWYRALLGCRNDHGRPDFDRLTDGDRVLLMLHRREAAEHGLPRPTPGHAGEGVLIWIHVDDIAAIHRRAQTVGATIVVPPHQNPQAGWTEMTVRDPDGYRIAIVQT
jgi:predicted enzyme related to lactoylglutathione lyase